MGKGLKNRHSTKTIKIVICAVLLVLLAAGTFVYFGFNVIDIEYAGNNHYTEEEMNKAIFGTEHPNAVLYTLFGNKNKSIPFVQKYDVEVQWPNTMQVAVYEKAIVGYINYMGCKMYFDKDGIVVESSSENYKGVSEIAGLQFRSIVLDSKLDVGNEQIFTQILEMTQAFDKYDLEVEKVYFDSSYNVSLYLNEVRVMLGSVADCTDKLYVLKQISGDLIGRKGTLYMESCDGTQESVIFKQEN